MAHDVEIETSAAKQPIRIARADRATAKRIDKAIMALADEPRPQGALKMTESASWRIRVWNYRVIYLIDDAVTVVTVTKVGHRQSNYER